MLSYLIYLSGDAVIAHQHSVAQALVRCVRIGEAGELTSRCAFLLGLNCKLNPLAQSLRESVDAEEGPHSYLFVLQHFAKGVLLSLRRKSDLEELIGYLAALQVNVNNPELERQLVEMADVMLGQADDILEEGECAE